MRNILSALSIFQQILWVVLSAVLVVGFIFLGGWGGWAAGFMALCGFYAMLGEACARTQGGESRFPPLGIPPRVSKKSRELPGVFLCACSFIFLWQIILPSYSSLWMSKRVSHFISTLPSGLVSRRNPAIAVGYQEPSLVFELGKEKVLMRNLFDAISFKPQDISPRLLLLTQEQLPCFEQLANDWNLNWLSLGKMKGFPYNRGRQSMLHFILVSGAVYGHAKANSTGILVSFISSYRPLLFFCRSSSLDFFRPY